VACGYSQVPGVDFHESFTPVINDVTFQILLVMMLTWNLKSKVVDIKTAFFHGDLKETFYMEIPKGMEASVDECLILNKTIYGLVQSAREFYSKLVSALKDCGFQGSLLDPCLWIKHFNQGIVIIAIYVNDCLIIGDDSDINEVIEELKGYNVGRKIEDDLTDYLSCRIITNFDNKTLFIMQPHLFKNLKTKFGAEIMNLSNYSTPGTPRFKIVQPSKMSTKLIQIYKLGTDLVWECCCF
jgi:Reverse transcriptase (RNA-dependent DNA polymerase)